MIYIDSSKIIVFLILFLVAYIISFFFGKKFERDKFMKGCVATLKDIDAENKLRKLYIYYDVNSVEEDLKNMEILEHFSKNKHKK